MRTRRLRRAWLAFSRSLAWEVLLFDVALAIALSALLSAAGLVGDTLRFVLLHARGVCWAFAGVVAAVAAVALLRLADPRAAWAW
jgi:hypothetical protein